MSPSPRVWDRQPGELIACGCGCGETVRNPDVRGRPRRFVRGHSLRVDSSAQSAAAIRTWTGRRHTPEARAKLSIAASVPKPWLRGEGNGMFGRTGASNPRWKGGGSPERQRLYASAEWKALRRTVFKRDGAVCSCGEIRDLHLHHVKPWAEYPELRFDPDNIVVLCRECHHAAHRKEVVL